MEMERTIKFTCEEKYCGKCEYLYEERYCGINNEELNVNEDDNYFRTATCLKEANESK